MNLFLKIIVAILYLDSGPLQLVADDLHEDLEQLPPNPRGLRGPQGAEVSRQELEEAAHHDLKSMGDREFEVAWKWK